MKFYCSFSYLFQNISIHKTWNAIKKKKKRKNIFKKASQNKWTVGTGHFIVFIGKKGEMKRKFSGLKKITFFDKDKQDMFPHMETHCFFQPCELETTSIYFMLQPAFSAGV